MASQPSDTSALQAARERIGLSRAELAERSGVPADTLRRWEDGTRRPRDLSRLRALMDALDCPSADRNAILAEAGYPPERTLFPSDRFTNYFYTVGELQDVVEQVSWPEFVLNDNIEIVAANRIVQALWGVDFAEERARRKSPQMNLLGLTSRPDFIRHVLNWDEAVATLASVLKGRPRDPHTLDRPDPYFSEVLAEFAQGDPTFLRRLIEVFAAAPAREPKCRWTYPVVWNADRFGEIRFVALVNTASEPDGLAFNDWIPLDGRTWEALEAIRKRT